MPAIRRTRIGFATEMMLLAAAYHRAGGRRCSIWRIEFFGRANKSGFMETRVIVRCVVRDDLFAGTQRS